jgi:hypothetical protein
VNLHKVIQYIFLCVFQYIHAAPWIFDISVCCSKLLMIGTWPWPWLWLLSKESQNKHTQIVLCSAHPCPGSPRLCVVFHPREGLMKRIVSPLSKMVCKQSCLQAGVDRMTPSVPSSLGSYDCSRESTLCLGLMHIN